MDARVPALPQPFEAWFASRGWRPRAHQVELVRRAQEGLSTLLIAPTGAGKTLAGFLPSLIELAPLAPTKRGDLLTLALARIAHWAPGHRRIGLSATVADPEGLAKWLVGARKQTLSLAERVVAKRPGEGRSDEQAPERLNAPHPPAP